MANMEYLKAMKREAEQAEYAEIMKWRALATEASTITAGGEETETLLAKAVGGGMGSDLGELRDAARKFADHAFASVHLDGGHTAATLGFTTTSLKFLASFAAIYLLILDWTNWRTNMLTSLLVPYIFMSLPSSLFSLMRGEAGKWIASIAVVLRLFFPQHFPDWLEMPGSLILLVVVAPHFFAHVLRDGPMGVLVCLAIGCYLLQEHIRASGGFRNSFTKSHGLSNTLGIILLLVYPIWRLMLHVF